MSHVSNNNVSIRNQRPHCLYKSLQVVSSPLDSAKLNMKAPAENGKTLSCRQRQWKKDENIRKKIEQELSKKRKSRISTKGVIFHPDKKIKGTVSALGLSPALAVGTKSLVLEAAQWMMVKKHNCVIVMDNQGNPCGTVAAKDITYRLVACRLSGRSATVADIMERNLVCVASTTPAHVAIDLMIARGARHAIVHSKIGKVSGLLDITKCLHILIRRMEKGYELEKAEQECVQFAPYPHDHTRLLRDNTVHPTLFAMSKHHSHKPKFVRVSIRDQVHNVIDMMKVNWATAALVYDDCRLVGIFTPKDVVLRVVAAGITLYNCSMVRIMTPQPDVATFSTSILEAFKMMNDGCFKNMPLMDKNGDIVDLVDIMELIQLLENHRTWLCCNNGADSSCVTTTADDNTADSGFSSPMLLHETPILRLPGSGWNSRLQPETNTSSPEDSLAQNIFSFKFSVGSTTHRINWDYRDFSGLQAIIRQRVIATCSYSAATYPQSSSIAIAYCDNEGDEILMTCNADLIDAVQMAHKMDQDRVRLVVYYSTTEEPEITFYDYEDTTLFTHTRQQHPMKARSMHHLSAQALAATCTCSSDTTLDEEAFGYPSSTTIATARNPGDDLKQDGVFTDESIKRQDKIQESDDHDPVHSQWISDHLLLPTTISFLSVAILSVFSSP